MFMNILISFMKIAFLAVLLVIAFALAFYMLLFEPDKMVSGTNCVSLGPSPIQPQGGLLWVLRAGNTESDICAG